MASGGATARLLSTCGAFFQALVRRASLRGASPAVLLAAGTVFLVLFVLWLQGRARRVDIATWLETFRNGLQAVFFLAMALAPCAMLLHRSCARWRVPASPGFLRAGVFAALVVALAWLNHADVWRVHFDAAGFHYIAYNACRVLLMLLLFFMLAGAGRLLPRPAATGDNEETAPLDALLLCFYGGAAVWIIGVFILGIAGLLYFWLLAPLACLAAWFGIPVAGRAIRRAMSWHSPTLPSLLGTAAVLSMAIGFICVWAVVFLNSGIAVGGFEYDSSGHYLPYYRSVVENRGLQPNEQWYHFWVSKGASLHLLMALLADIQSPQLVSLVFAFVAMMTLAAMVRRATLSWIWAAVAALVFSAAFIGHFPYFQKHHLVTLGLIAGILWLSQAEAFNRRQNYRPVTLTLVAVAAALNAPPIAAILVPYLACTCALNSLKARSMRPREGAAEFIPFIAASAALTGMLVLNYAWTGLAEVTPFKMFMMFGNEARLSRFVSPYLILMVDEASSETTGRLSVSAVHSVSALIARIGLLLRAEGFAPHLASILKFAAPIGLLLLIPRASRARLLGGFGRALLFVAIACLVGFFINQPGSLERFYTFAFLPAVFLGIGSLALVTESLLNIAPSAIRTSLAALVFVAAAALAAASDVYWLGQWVHLHGWTHLNERLRFAVGQRSFRDALTYVHYRRDEKGWPRRDLSDECIGISQRAAELGGAAGPLPRIWTITFLQESGCHVLPKAKIEMEFSVAFGNRWHRIVFGPAEEARRELQRIGVDYFYVNLADFDMKRLEAISTSVFGCLAYSPLFSADQLQGAARLLWQKGDAYLFTLQADKGGAPVDAAWLAAWTRKVDALQHGLGDMQGICRRLARYYKEQGESWPVRADPTLPRLKGWQ